jgi:alkylated DNA nucleotide flippase Atl1
MKLGSFNEQVYSIVKKIPRGQVATYGQIAAILGKPRAARIVGWSLHQLDYISSLPLTKGENKRGSAASRNSITKHQTHDLPLTPSLTRRGEEYPWWRVVNSQGFISTTCQEHTFEMQKQMLEQEGVDINWNKKKHMYRLDLDKYLWRP